jgi:hypothetical protein
MKAEVKAQHGLFRRDGAGNFLANLLRFEHARSLPMTCTRPPGAVE